MKKLTIPQSLNTFYDTSKISQTLDSLNRKRENDGNNVSLYGAYKKIRTMYLFAGIGDFPILAECVFWLREIGYPPTKTEIRRCMMYFQPKLSQWERKNLSETFFETADDSTYSQRNRITTKRTEAKQVKTYNTSS